MPGGSAGDLRIESVFSKNGDIYLKADGSIIDALQNNATKVFGRKVYLWAGNAIGTDTDALEVHTWYSADQPTAGNLTAYAVNNINLADSEEDMGVRIILSFCGDVTLKAANSILDAGDVAKPTDPMSGNSWESVGGRWPVKDVIGNNITLTAVLGGIGTSANELDIDSAFSAAGKLTSTSGNLLNAYIIETDNDLTLNTVQTGPDRTAYITAPSGSILNGNPGGENIIGGKTKLFAAYNIGAADNYIASQVGYLEGKSSAGSTWIINNGSLTTGGISDDVTGVDSGGSIHITAGSPITVNTNMTSEANEIVLWARDDNDLDGSGNVIADNITVPAGYTIWAKNSYILLVAGDSLTIADGATLLAKTTIELRGDWGSQNLSTTLNATPDADRDPGEGAVMNINGALTAPSGLYINTYADDDVLNLYTFNLSGNTYASLRGGNDVVNQYSSAPVSGTVMIDGDDGDDTFNLTTNSATVTVHGDGGNDVFNLGLAAAAVGTLNLFGDAGNDLFNLLSDGSPAAVNLTLNGGTDNDRWVFAPHWGQIDSVVDESGEDTFDFSGVGSSEKLRFYIAGTYFYVTIGNIDPTTNTANSVWQAGNTIEHLISGPDNDSFHFADGASLASGDPSGNLGDIDARGSTADLLDYSEYTTPVTVDLSTSTATGLATLTGIENVTGGHANDSITGDSNNNVLNGAQGDDTLAGGAGDDTYMFLDNWGHDTVIENAGEGSDTLDFYAYDGIPSNFFYSYGGDTITYMSKPVRADLSFYLSNDASGDVVKDNGNSANQVDFTSRTFEYLYGGLGIDSLYTLDQDSQFDLDGIIKDTEPGFYPDRAVVQRPAADTNTYTALVEAYSLEFMNIERLLAGMAADTFNILENQVFELHGGAGDDRFVFSNGATLSDLTDVHPAFQSSIDGQGGIDTLDLSQYTTGVTANLITGQANFVSGSATGRLITLENLVGGSGNDTLTGDAGNNIITGNGGDDVMTGGLGNDTFVFGNDWGHDVVNEYADEGTDLLDFAAVTIPLTFNLLAAGLNVSDGSNTVTYSGNDVEDLTGGTADDQFIFYDNAVLPGKLDGGAGTNSIDFSNYTSERDVLLTNLGSLNGFAGTEMQMGMSFDNISQITGSASGDDRITGMDAEATFTINAVENAYTVESTVLTFSQFEHVSGGGLADTFNFMDTNQQVKEYLGGAGNDVFALIGSILVPGKINGQGGTDTLTYADFTTGGVNVNLASGAATAIYGALVGGLSSIENVIGSVYNDVLTGDIWNNLLDGNDGDDVLDGAEGDDTLLGGLGSDIFNFLADWGNDVASDLGGLFDTVNFSAVDTALLFTLGLGGFAATTTLPSGNTLTFNGNSIELIRGGKREDEFVFEDGAVLTTDNAGVTGQIDGEGGVNRLNYSAYTSGVSVDLAAGTATGTGGIAHINDVYGGLGNDALYGDDSNNVFRGGAGNDVIAGRGGVDTLDESNATVDLSINLSLTSAQTTGLGSDTFANLENVLTGSGNDTITGNTANNVLNGGSGNDTYAFLEGFGTDTVVDSAGNDTLDFSAVTTALTFALDTAATTVSTGTNSVSTGLEIENYVGGSNADTFQVNSSRSANLDGDAGADRFIFATGVTLTGTIDGAAGSDTLDWSTSSSAQTVALTATGATDGFAGTATSLSGSFTNIDALVGSSASDSLTGLAADSTWNIDTQNTYVSMNTLTFAGFEALVGGAGVDTFAFHGSSTFTGTLDGGAGSDGFDFSDYSSDAVIDLQNATVTGLNGTFTRIENFTGNALHTNTVMGTTGADTFAIDGAGSGTLNGWFVFQQIQAVDGLTGTDNFDLSALTSPAVITLTALGSSDGFAGSETTSALSFQNIDQITGTAGSDSLTGMNGDSTWQVTGTDAGFYTHTARTLAFDAIENWWGGTGNNTLSYELLSDPVAVTLVSEGSLQGYTGTATDLSGGFTNMNLFQGSSASDSFTGMAADATWNLNTTTIYSTSASRSASLSGFEALIGGSAADTFAIEGTHTFAGSIDGGAGSGVDRLTYQNSSSPASIVLSGLGTVSGFAGSASAISSGFDNIDVLVGSSLSDSLTGADQIATFELDGSDRYLSGGHELAFSAFEKLYGGALADTFAITAPVTYDLFGAAGNDTFQFGLGGNLTGSIDGGVGSDWIDLSATTAANIIRLTSLGTNDGFGGTVANLLSGGFDDIDGLRASGTAVSDTIYGLDADSQWDLNGSNTTYTAGTRVLALQNFEQYQGGIYVDTFILHGAEHGLLFGNAGDDVFHVNNGAGLSGTIKGGGGVNLLDYSDYTTSVSVNLATGTATNITSIDAIQNVYGGSADDTLLGNNGENVLKGNGGNDVLNGGDGNDVYLFGDNFGQDTLSEGIGVDTLDFSAVTSSVIFNLAAFNAVNGSNSVTYTSNIIERFIGSAADDTFYFTGSFALPASSRIDGSLGSDWLDYTSYASGVTVNLGSGTATGVNAVANIENVRGSSYNDSLTGSAVANILIGGAGADTLTGAAGNDTLDGGSGNDTYVFSGSDWGQDTLSDTAGSDTLDFTNASNDLTFAIGTGSLAVSGGSNMLTSLSGNVIERLLGGLGNDTFAFADSAVLAGDLPGTFIDGGAGNNTLDYTAYTTTVYVNLSTHTTTGVNAEQTNGIANIQNIKGGVLYNEIWGDDNDNILVSGSTNDNLHGLGGNDTYVFYDNWGTDYVFDTTGNDTLTFINVTTGLTFTFKVGSAVITDGLGNTITTDGNVENFIGTSKADTFVWENNASVAGKVDGRGGSDTLNLSAFTSVRHVTLTNVGSVDGFAGVEAAMGSFDNMDVLVASPLNGDSLTGRNAAAAFTLDTVNRYDSVNTLTFSGFEILNGGSDSDTFAVRHFTAATLNGGAGADSFVFSAGAVLTGTLDGQSGSDTLDLSALSARTLTLSALGSVDGFNGTDAVVSGGFANIDALIGTAGSDTLRGIDQAATFELDGSNRYLSGTHALAFTSFENLVGGSAADTFAFGGTYSFTGTLDGGSGTDRVDYSAYASAINFNLQSMTLTGLVGTFTSIEGLVGSAANADSITASDGGTTFNMTGVASGTLNSGFTFASIENLIGGAGADTLNYTAYPTAVTLDMQAGTATGLVSFSGIETVIGSAFSDSILARNAGSSFIISGANSGSVDGLAFASFENLVGAAGADLFNFISSGSLSGTLSGGAGSDTLSYAGYSSPVTVSLNTLTATGLAAGFSGIETLVGSAASDTLVGTNNGSNFVVSGANSGLADAYAFSAFENLTGGSGADRFNFVTGGSLDGSLAGGAGVDWIDYSGYASGVIVNLLSGTATAVGGAVSGIENILGSTNNDVLTGDNNDNVINTGGGIDLLAGNGGNDRFIFPAGSSFSGTLAGGAGTDTVDFSAGPQPARVCTLSAGQPGWLQWHDQRCGFQRYRNPDCFRAER